MSHVEKFLLDYTAPTHAILSCELIFTITDAYTTVENRLQLQRNTGSENILVLSGVELELQGISLDGNMLASTEYSRDTSSLTLENPPDIFTLFIITRIYPEKNTALE